VIDTMRLSVVIVSYECRDVLRDCLRSLVAALSSEDEIIVVDNASQDGTVDMLAASFRDVRVVANTSNIGFAAATNAGVRAACGRLTLILNPDARVPSGSVEQLVACLDALAGDALVGPRLLDGDGATIQRSAFRFPTPVVVASEQLTLSRFATNDAANIAPDHAPVPVDWLKGACLLGPTAMLKRYGPFDERFFMFSEDTDLCYRLHADGIPVLYVPGVSIIHIGGVSTRPQRSRMTSMFVDSLYRYYQKHHSRYDLAVVVMTIRYIAAMKVARAGVRWAWLRATGKPEARHQRDEAATYLKVMTLRQPRRGYPAEPNDRMEVETARPARQDPPEAEVATLEAGLVEAGAEQAPVAKGSVALLTSFGVIAILNYAFAVTMSWLLPVAQYGAVGVGQAVLVMGATVVEAGFPWALARALAQARSREEQARAFRAAFVGNSVLGLCVSLMVAGVALAGIVQPTDIYTPILLIASASIAVLTANSVLGGAMQGWLLQRQLAVVRVTEVTVKVCIGVILVVLGFGAVGAIAGFLAGAIVSTIIAATFLRGLPISIRGGWKDRRLVRAAGPIFLTMVGFALLSQVDLLTLKAFSPVASADFMTGQYQVAVILGRIPFFAGVVLFGAVFPHVSRTAGRVRESHAYAALAFKYTMLFLIPLGLMMAVVPDELIRLLFSSRYDASSGALAVVAIAMCILTLAFGCATLLQARGRNSLPALTLAVAVPLEVTAAALAVPAFGMNGAAGALGLSSALVLAVLGPSVVRSYGLRTSISEGLRYAAALAVFALALRFGVRGDRIMTGLGLAGAWMVYALALVLVRLITVGDVDTLGGAFGSRGLRLRRRIAGLVRAAQP
jgi:N-acetylglucosaminyl-diphospho-decaprenol L-rhamnosyltransferase